MEIVQVLFIMFVGLYRLIFSSIIIAAAIPFVLLAAFTTALAFSTLFVRVLIIYTELAMVLIRNYSIVPLYSNSAVVRRD